MFRCDRPFRIRASDRTFSCHSNNSRASHHLGRSRIISVDLARSRPISHLELVGGGPPAAELAEDFLLLDHFHRVVHARATIHHLLLWSVVEVVVVEVVAVLGYIPKLQSYIGPSRRWRTSRGPGAPRARSRSATRSPPVSSRYISVSK